MYTQQRVLKGDSLAEAHSHTSTHALFPQQQLFVQNYEWALYKWRPNAIAGLCLANVISMVRRMPSLSSTHSNIAFTVTLLGKGIAYMENEFTCDM